MIIYTEPPPANVGDTKKVIKFAWLPRRMRVKQNKETTISSLSKPPTPARNAIVWLTYYTSFMKFMPVDSSLGPETVNKWEEVEYGVTGQYDETGNVWWRILLAVCLGALILLVINIPH